MTVAELIELLKSFPPTAMVVTRGYEAGFSDPEVRAQRIDPNAADGGGVYGKHGPIYDDSEASEAAVDAVLIDRE